MTKCPNCGAVITGPKCEYCGTVFRDYQPFVEESNLIKTNMINILTTNELRQLVGLEPLKELQADVVRRRNYGRYV